MEKNKLVRFTMFLVLVVGLCLSIFFTEKEVCLQEIAFPSLSKKPKIINNSQYIIYIPSRIDHSKRYPLVVALSPSADAQSMIRTWKGTAEKYKWIIFASKESRNRIDANWIMSRLVSHLEWLLLNFPIDKDKIIATGFSGGAMGSHAFSFSYPELISAVVINTGMIHEKYIEKKYEYPRGKLAVFLASPTDFRYDEMKRDRKFLESLGWKTNWIEFKGGHCIAPDTIYRKAAKWLQEEFR